MGPKDSSQGSEEDNFSYWVGDSFTEDATEEISSDGNVNITQTDNTYPANQGDMTWDKGHSELKISGGGGQGELTVSGTVVADSFQTRKSDVDEELKVGECVQCDKPLEVFDNQLVALVVEDKLTIRPDPPCCSSCLESDPKMLARLRDEVRDRTGLEIYQDGETMLRVYDEDPNVEKLRSALDTAWAEMVTIEALLDDPATA